MPAQDGFAPHLEEIPFTTRAFASATLESGQRLILASAPDVSSENALPQALIAIRNAKLELHFFIARQGEEIIFFFFKKQLPTLRPLVATLRAVMQAAEDAAPHAARAALPPSSTLRAEPCSYRLLAPTFLLLRPTAEELRRYAPPGTKDADGVLLRVGPEGRYVLGIRNPEAETKATVLYTTDKPRLLDSWDAEPFLALIETLRAWVADGKKRVNEQTLDLPTDPTEMTDAQATLHWFVEGYRSMEQEALRRRSQALPAPLGTLIPNYAPGEYVAEIELSLDNDGHFVEPKNQNPVSLGLRMEVGRELDVLVARITLTPPDFLVSGELRDAFLEQLRGCLSTSILRSLDMESGGWPEFLSDAKDRAVVFRTGRESAVDTDVVVLGGTWRGRQRTLILTVKAEVNASRKPPAVKLSKAELCYDSLADTKRTLDSRTMSYFMRLAAALKDWLDALAEERTKGSSA